MSVEDQSSATPAFKDRSNGLFIYGIAQVALGCLAALMVPLMLLSLLVSPPQGGASAAQMIPAAGIYATIAVALVWLGVGSMRARRWARALTLVLAWIWLAMGVMTLVVMIVWMPNMAKMIESQGDPMPPQAMTFVYIVMLGTMGCMYLVLPSVFIVFYGRADVRATCEAKDPHVRWTDRCPLPVLSLSLLLAFAATSIVWSAGYGFVTPFFGFVLKGIAGAIFFLGLSVLFGYLAWATYKLKIGAWWTSLCVCVLLGLSTLVSFSRMNVLDFYREMNFPEDQLKIMEDSGVFDMNMPLMIGVNFAMFVGYLLWVRGYFVAGVTSNRES